MFKTPRYLFHPDGDTGTGGADGNKQTPPPKKDDPPPRSYSEEDMQQIVDSRISQEIKRLRTRFEGVDPDEFKKLRDEKAARERKEAEEEKNYQAALKSVNDAFEAKEKTWRSERDSLLTEVRSERIINRLLSSATKANAYDAAQVAALLEKRVRLGDDRQPVVLDDRGEPAFKEGKPLTVDQLVSDYLDRNPHLVRASGTGGSGADGGKSRSGEGRGESDDLKTARARLTELDESFKGRRPSAGELADRQKLLRRITQLEKEQKEPALRR